MKQRPTDPFQDDPSISLSPRSTGRIGIVRFVVVFLLIGAVLVLLLVRFATIMLGDSTASGSVQRAGAVERGPILDRNGRILAIQTELDTVWAWRPDIDDPEGVAAALGPALDLEVSALRDKLSGDSGSVTIKRTISPTESEAVRDLQAAGRIVGVRLRKDAGRSYPERSSLGPVIGFVGDDGEGLTGIEYTMEPWLIPAERDARFGNQVFLTVDMNIQYESERLAAIALDQYDADSVVLITMDSTTGDILALASVPGFDPNRFAEYENDERRNRPISQVYEPGSVFKIFTVGSFLQLGGIGADSLFPTTGSYDRTDPPIRDLANYGTIDTTGIIRLSSNVGAALASETVNGRMFHNMLKLFGFADKTGIELNGEEVGLLAAPDTWSRRTQPTLAIGQEIGVTALQLVSAATVFANDGVLLKPNIIDKVVSASGQVIRDFGRTPVREVTSPEVAATILAAMESAVADQGTARRLEFQGLQVAAKTGTAEKIDPATGSYSEDAFLASTLAIFPADDPKVIVYVAIDYPRGDEFYGGRIAVPLVREYMDFLVPYLGIPVEGYPVLARPNQITVTPKVLPELRDVVPDYSGLPKRSLLPLLTRTDVVISLDGYGWVVAQTPAAGTPFTPGMQITLELK